MTPKKLLKTPIVRLQISDLISTIASPPLRHHHRKYHTVANRALIKIFLNNGWQSRILYGVTGKLLWGWWVILGRESCIEHGEQGIGFLWHL